MLFFALFFLSKIPLAIRGLGVECCRNRRGRETILNGKMGYKGMAVCQCIAQREGSQQRSLGGISGVMENGRGQKTQD